jgi:hypothetical protein
LEDAVRHGMTYTRIPSLLLTLLHKLHQMLSLEDSAHDEVCRPGFADLHLTQLERLVALDVCSELNIELLTYLQHGIAILLELEAIDYNDRCGEILQTLADKL